MSSMPYAPGINMPTLPAPLVETTIQTLIQSPHVAQLEFPSTADAQRARFAFYRAWFRWRASPKGNEFLDQGGPPLLRIVLQTLESGHTALLLALRFAD